MSGASLGSGVRSVVFLSTGLGYGGATTLLIQLALRLKEKGWDVRVVSILRPYAFVDRLVEAEIPLESLHVRRKFPDPRIVLGLSSLLRRWEPSILHSHMVHANLLARISRPLHRVPIVISTVHSINEGSRLREIAYRLTDMLCDLSTTVSRTAADHHTRLGTIKRHKLRVIPNGIDTERFRRDALTRAVVRRELGVGERFAWLAIGRFVSSKDYPNLLMAVAQLLQWRPEFRERVIFLIVGQGPLESKIKELVGKLGLGEWIRFLGVRRDIPQLMSAADGYVMSSAWEGMPMALLEASAAELPIVATDVGGNREIVVDGRSGFLVPPKDPEALARSMVRVMEMPEADRRTMGISGRAHVEANYSFAGVTDMWEALYLELLSKKGLI